MDLTPFNLKPASHIDGLDENFYGSLYNLLSAAQGAGHEVSINSGFRSPEHQARLWENALKKYGSPEKARKWVAPPGKSQHNHGTAADLRYASDAAKAWIHENAKTHGLHFRMPWEDWHIEPYTDGQPQTIASSDHKHPPATQEPRTDPMDPINRQIIQGADKSTRLNQLAESMGFVRPQRPRRQEQEMSSLFKALGLNVPTQDMRDIGAALMKSDDLFSGLGDGLNAISAREAQKADDDLVMYGIDNANFESDRNFQLDLLKASQKDGANLKRVGNLITADGKRLGAGVFHPQNGYMLVTENGLVPAPPGTQEAGDVSLNPKGNGYSRIGNMVDREGNPLGASRFNKTTGQPEVKGEDGRWTPAPSGAREVSESLGGALTPLQFNNLETELIAEEKALTQLTRYWDTVGGMNAGIEGLSDKVSANFKALFNEGLTPEELNNKVANGQIEGLLGGLRLDVVGPGVLTEQDAQRIYNYLGGDLGLLTNKEAVAQALSYVLQDKQSRYEGMTRQYNRSAPTYTQDPWKLKDFNRVPADMGGLPDNSTVFDDPDLEDLINRYSD
ncbi:M15 family metallopeptidase [Pyruvatibacter sp.]